MSRFGGDSYSTDTVLDMEKRLLEPDEPEEPEAVTVVHGPGAPPPVELAANGEPEGKGIK